MARPRVYVLTDRQRAVMDLVCLGKTMEEASMILGVNVNTREEPVGDRAKEARRPQGDTLAVAKYLAPERFRK